MPAPDIAPVKEYLGQTGTTYSDAAITRALVAETAAQATVCNVGDSVPADLAEALLRRVARNLAMSRLPLGVMSDETGSTRIGSNDPEVRRLEGPYRKRIMG